MKQSLLSSSWRCLSWDPSTSALPRRREESETGALTRPELLSAKWAFSDAAGAQWFPEGSTVLSLSSQGAPGWQYLYFHHHANKKRGLGDLEAEQETAQQLGQKREGAGF